MKWIIRTVSWSPERAENVAKLCQILPEAIVLTDTEHDAYKTMMQALELSATEGAVIMEDDAILCRHFEERVRAIIGLHPGEVCQFWERWTRWHPTAYIGGSNFYSTLCTYFPPDIGPQINSYYQEFKEKRPKDWYGMATDCFVSYALVKMHRKYWRIRPMLVQHAAFKSVIGGPGRPVTRQTPFFIDDLEDKGIDYMEMKP